MHHKAGILALHGVLPMVFAGQDVERGMHFRLRWDREQGEPQLMLYHVDETEIDVQWTVKCAAARCNYTLITWEEIPDEIMDTLSMELIEEFLKTQP